MNQNRSHPVSILKILHLTTKHTSLVAMPTRRGVPRPPSGMQSENCSPTAARSISCHTVACRGQRSQHRRGSMGRRFTLYTHHAVSPAVYKNNLGMHSECSLLWELFAIQRFVASSLGFSAIWWREATMQVQMADKRKKHAGYLAQRGKKLHHLLTYFMNEIFVRLDLKLWHKSNPKALTATVHWGTASVGIGFYFKHIECWLAIYTWVPLELNLIKFLWIKHTYNSSKQPGGGVRGEWVESMGLTVSSFLIRKDQKPPSLLASSSLKEEGGMEHQLCRCIAIHLSCQINLCCTRQYNMGMGLYHQYSYYVL